MAVVEDDLKRDEMERDNLQRIISEVETELTISNPGKRAAVRKSPLNTASWNLSLRDLKSPGA